MPLLGVLCAGLVAWALARYSDDQCSWTGSGLSQKGDLVEQLTLHCAEGSVEWLYPAGALRLTLSPRPPPPRRLLACIRPADTFRGAQVYLERAGVLELLLEESAAGGSRAGPAGGRCFAWEPWEKVALFLLAAPHRDISRRVAAFRYELRDDGHPRRPLFSGGLGVEGTCRPCNDTEVLTAACTSDFVLRGTIRDVRHDLELQEAVISVGAALIHRQKLPLFQPAGWRAGTIRTPLRCGVRPGPGTFLFTGWGHFGQAWLGCAPRYRDFRRLYEEARAARRNPCELGLG
ncbi:meteorin [Ornithorhynchus anatinus]|uniref:Meteorin, glial cell differentiation regulator n=1 Tax=Ornithorhynchus anatinus TaxID=9258 RepID=A0A6I8N6L4_ORNAN|nr:meteorin [Ornithorhynchus anatinus]